MTTHVKSDGVATSTPTATVAPHVVRIDVNGLSRQVGIRNWSELTLFDAVSFTISAGELVAIVGPSGAGKTTLQEGLRRHRPAETSHSVRFAGIDVCTNLGTFRSVLGYVPQDEIIHADLPSHARSAMQRDSGSPWCSGP